MFILPEIKNLTALEHISVLVWLSKDYFLGDIKNIF